MKVAFMGKMGVGKSTAAKYLVDNYGYVKLSFADPVKVVTAQMLNQLESYITLYGLNNNENKEWTLGRVDTEKKNPIVRHMLQFVGTELGREFVGYEDLWLDMFLRDAEQLKNIVNDDVRFVNEANALREQGFKIIKIRRKFDDPLPLDFTTTHTSETSLDKYVPDAIVYNDHSIGRFHRDIDFVLNTLSQENTRSREGEESPCI